MVHSFKLETKILSVTCDNASNNDTMMENLDDLLSGFSSLNRTRCFAHILNLVAKALLKQFDMKSDDSDRNDLNCYGSAGPSGVQGFSEAKSTRVSHRV